VQTATGTLGSPNVARRADLAIFSGIWTHASHRVALERMTIAGLTPARVAAAAVIPRSAAKSLGTFAMGWRPPPSSWNARPCCILKRNQAACWSAVLYLEKKSRNQAACWLCGGTTIEVRRLGKFDFLIFNQNSRTRGASGRPSSTLPSLQFALTGDSFFYARTLCLCVLRVPCLYRGTTTLIEHRTRTHLRQNSEPSGFHLPF
jgi:hypothetical protein